MIIITNSTKKILELLSERFISKTYHKSGRGDAQAFLQIATTDLYTIRVTPSAL